MLLFFLTIAYVNRINSQIKKPNSITCKVPKVQFVAPISYKQHKQQTPQIKSRNTNITNIPNAISKRIHQTPPKIKHFKKEETISSHKINST